MIIFDGISDEQGSGTQHESVTHISSSFLFSPQSPTEPKLFEKIIEKGQSFTQLLPAPHAPKVLPHE